MSAEVMIKSTVTSRNTQLDYITNYHMVVTLSETQPVPCHLKPSLVWMACTLCLYLCD